MSTLKPGTIIWSARHGAWRLNEKRGTFSLHATREGAEAFAIKLGYCTSDDPSDHQGDTCPVHES